MAYKVTSKNNRSVVISNSSMQHSKYDVTYIENLWVKGPSPLYVFKTLKDAYFFVDKVLYKKREDIRIWRCQTKNLQKIKYVSLVEDIIFFDSFWRGYFLGTLCSPYFLAPRESYSATEVKITKKVKR